MIAYGRNESEKGEAGLDAFRQQLAKLCADVRTAAEKSGLVDLFAAFTPAEERVRAAVGGSRPQ